MKLNEDQIKFKNELQSLINDLAYDHGLYSLNFTYEGWHECEYAGDNCYCSVESELIIEEIS